MVTILQKTLVQVTRNSMKEIEELLELTRENNLMLKSIMNYLYNHSQNDDQKDFIMNVIANLVSNRCDYGVR